MTERLRFTCIFEYPLPLEDEVSIAMPDGAEILCVQVQHGTPKLWAKVNTSAPDVTRRFAVYGTGHPMFVGQQTYIGTFQLSGGGLVLHVLELGAA